MIRVQMDVAESMMDLLKDLQVRTGAESIAEVLRQAASTYDVIIHAHESGKEIRIGKDYILHSVITTRFDK